MEPGRHTGAVATLVTLQQQPVKVMYCVTRTHLGGGEERGERWEVRGGEGKRGEGRGGEGRRGEEGRREGRGGKERRRGLEEEGVREEGREGRGEERREGGRE